MVDPNLRRERPQFFRMRFIHLQGRMYGVFIQTTRFLYGEWCEYVWRARDSQTVRRIFVVIGLKKRVTTSYRANYLSPSFASLEQSQLGHIPFNRFFVNWNLICFNLGRKGTIKQPEVPSVKQPISHTSNFHSAILRLEKRKR
jgi:hypothetical protein